MNLSMLNFEPVCDSSQAIKDTLNMHIKRTSTTIPARIYNGIGCPDYVRFSYDKKNKIMQVKGTDENDVNALKVHYSGHQPFLTTMLHSSIRNIVGLDSAESLVLADGRRTDAKTIVFCKTYIQRAGVNTLIGSVNLD